jgi:hypothetical protein
VGGAGQLVSAKLGGMGFVGGGGGLQWILRNFLGYYLIIFCYYQVKFVSEVYCLNYYHVKLNLFCMLK